MKRALIILGILLIMGGVLGLGYYLSMRGITETPIEEVHLSVDNPAAVTPSGNTPAETRNDSYATVNPDPGLAFYVDPSGNIISVERDGRIAQYRGTLKEFLSPEALTRPALASFSFDGSRILVGWNTPRQWSVFSIKDKTWTPLPPNITGPVWSGTEDNITYLSKTGGGTFIVEDPVSSRLRPRTLTRFDAEDVILNRVSKNVLLIQDVPSAEYKGSLFIYNVGTGVISKVAEGSGLSATWHALGDRGLVFTSGGGAKGGSLSLVGTKGEILETMNILTLPKKCIFRDEPVSEATSTSKTATPPAVRPYLICAVPEDLSELARAKLPDDYEKQALYTEDEFLKIDLRNGTIITLLRDGQTSFDAERLFVRNERVYFRNRFDEKLYSIPLNP